MICFPWTSSRVHCDDFDPVCVDVGEQDLGPPLDDVDQLVDALPAALALPVRLVQEQRLEESFPQPPAPQHRHRLLREPGQTGGKGSCLRSRGDLGCFTLCKQIWLGFNFIFIYNAAIQRRITSVLKANNNIWSERTTRKESNRSLPALRSICQSIKQSPP